MRTILRKAILILSDGIDNHSRYTEVRDQGIGARERPDLRHRHIRSERLVCRIHLEIGHRYRPHSFCDFQEIHLHPHSNACLLGAEPENHPGRIAEVVLNEVQVSSGR